MKKLIILIALLIAVPAHAVIFISGTIVSGACAPATPGSLYNENFEGVGIPASWTDSGSTPDHDYDTSGDPATGGCLEGSYYDVNGALLYAYYDHGSAIDIDTVNTDFIVYFKVVTAPDSGETVQIVNTGSSATPGSSLTLRVQLTNSSGTITVQASNGTTSSSTVTISTGTWYKMTLHFDTTAASSYFQIDAGSQNAITRNANDIRYFFLGGSGSIGGADNIQIVYDVFYLDQP